MKKLLETDTEDAESHDVKEEISNIEDNVAEEISDIEDNINAEKCSRRCCGGEN